MAKAIIICKEIQNGVDKGKPDVGTGYRGFVQIGQLPGAYCAYVITGTPAQLATIDAHANTLVASLVTEAEGGDKWAELRVQLPAGVRTKINTYRANNGQGPIPVNTTWLQVIRQAAPHFDLTGNFDVFDSN